jgi:hypothetical protein
MFAKSLVVCVILAACSSPAPKPAPAPAPEPTPSPAPADPTQKPAGPGIGETCGEGDACGAGTCVSYYGIAGARGPQFKTCEIRCEDDAACPKDRKCNTIADGPGRVCR